MWHFLDNHIAYKDDEKHHFLFPLLEPDWGHFGGEIMHIEPHHTYQ